MMGERAVTQEALFYGFSVERHVPADHLLRSVDRFVDLSGLREQLRPFYSETGRPSIDPELIIRMLLVGYCFGIRSERRLCEEVHLNLAYRWFCRLGLEGAVPDHSTFSKNRHYTSAHGGQAQFCYATNYLVDVQNAVIVDVEASTAVRQAEVTAAKRMIERVHHDLGLWPRKLIADTGYGSAEMLAWLVHERDIHPHIPVVDKSARRDGAFERADFAYDLDEDHYTCPAGKLLKRCRRYGGRDRDAPHADGFFRYRASKLDCDACTLKPRCCPGVEARKVTRSVHEGARNLARAIAEEDEWLTSRRERKKVEMLFAHLKRILRFDRLRLRGPNGARDEFHLAAAAQNLRKLAKLIPMPTQAVPA